MNMMARQRNLNEAQLIVRSSGTSLSLHCLFDGKGKQLDACALISYFTRNKVLGSLKPHQSAIFCWRNYVILSKLSIVQPLEARAHTGRPLIPIGCQ